MEELWNLLPARFKELLEENGNDVQKSLKLLSQEMETNEELRNEIDDLTENKLDVWVKNQLLKNKSN